MPIFYHRPRRRFGQHFLSDHFVIEEIIRAVAPKETDNILEIGPGQGALTQRLLPMLHDLAVLEIDRDLIAFLKTQPKMQEKLTIYQGDALEVDLRSLHRPYHGLWRLVGNLPYNISTPLLFHCLEQAHSIQDMHFMLQREVVDRLVAQPGQSNYGRLSVMLQYYCQAERLFNVKASAFHPAPKVESALVRLIPYRTLPYKALDPFVLADLVRLAFSHRRKMLRSYLGYLISSEQLARLGIDAQQRSERLSISDYVRLANFFKEENISFQKNI